jgi:hypothetical protein
MIILTSPDTTLPEMADPEKISFNVSLTVSIHSKYRDYHGRSLK